MVAFIFLSSSSPRFVYLRMLSRIFVPALIVECGMMFWPPVLLCDPWNVYSSEFYLMNS